MSLDTAVDGIWMMPIADARVRETILVNFVAV
jgi:hypothetical protein